MIEKLPSILIAIGLVVLPLVYKKLEVPDETYNQVMGLLAGLLAQQGVTKVKTVRASKKAKTNG